MDKKAERALQKAKEAQKRAIDKQIAKQSCPIYREKQLDKQRQQQQKQREKQLLKQKQGPTPEQLEKKLASQKKAQEKAQVKVKLKPRNTKTTKPLKLTGIKGKTRNKVELDFHDQIAAIGCICCYNQGLTDFDDSVAGQQYVSVHHVYGRTGKYSHFYCLPLCQWHHDVPLPKEMQLLYPSVVPIHAKGSVGGKTAWELINGTQDELIKQVWSMVGFDLKNVA